MQHAKYCTEWHNARGPAAPVQYGMLHSCWAITNTLTSLRDTLSSWLDGCNLNFDSLFEPITSISLHTSRHQTSARCMGMVWKQCRVSKSQTFTSPSFELSSGVRVVRERLLRNSYLVHAWAWDINLCVLVSWSPTWVCLAGNYKSSFPGNHYPTVNIDHCQHPTFH